MKDYARNKFQNEQKAPRHNKKQPKIRSTTQKNSNKKTQNSQPRQRIRQQAHQPDNRLTNKSNRNRTIATVTLLLITGVFLWWLLPNNSSNDTRPDNKPEKIKTPTLRAPAIFNTHNTNNETIRQKKPSYQTPETDQTGLPTTPDTSESQTQQNNRSEPTSQSMQDIANDLNKQMNELTTTRNDSSPPKFSFYDNLATRHVDSEAKPEKAKQYEYTYMLQVGSYRSKNAADAVRARLLLLGLKPKVSKHGSWYRIDVGPVHSKRQGDILKHKLEKAGISGSMLRQVSKREIKTPEQNDNQTSNNN